MDCILALGITGRLQNSDILYSELQALRIGDFDGSDHIIEWSRKFCNRTLTDVSTVGLNQSINDVCAYEIADTSIQYMVNQIRIPAQFGGTSDQLQLILNYGYQNYTVGFNPKNFTLDRISTSVCAHIFENQSANQLHDSASACEKTVFASVLNLVIQKVQALNRFDQNDHQGNDEDLENLTERELQFVLRDSAAELLWATKFNSISDSIPWFQMRSIAPSGAAANYSFLYILFWFLEYFQPQNILEFGVGQSTIITSQYANFFKQFRGTSLVAIDDSAHWSKTIQHRLTFGRDNNQPPTVPSASEFLILNRSHFFYRGFKTYFYENVDKHIGDKKFDFIIVDGPHRTGRFGRVGFIELIPQCLAERFVILVDDYDSLTIKDSALAFVNKLVDAKIPVNAHFYGGEKSQFLLFSPGIFLP